MSMSNWQNIPFCAEILMHIEPQRVLDIGVGFGRWGMITREFCDVGLSRVLPSQWAVHIEGVEGSQDTISEYHRSFYNHIHIGDARTIVPELSGNWDIVIFGDVLKHLSRNEGKALLQWALNNSAYVLVNLPLGSAGSQGNSPAQNLSEWNVADFKEFALVRHALFQNTHYHGFGSFVLSRMDPKNLKEAPFSYDSNYAYSPAAPRKVHLDESLFARVEHLKQRLQQSEAELSYIKGSRSYRVTQRLIRSRYGKFLIRVGRALLPAEGGVLRSLVKRDMRGVMAGLTHLRPKRVVTPDKQIRIRATTEKNPASQGYEVWLLNIRTDQQATHDLTQIQMSGNWTLQENPKGVNSHFLRTRDQGDVYIPWTEGMEIQFMTHPWSGQIEITGLGRKVYTDLYSAATSALYILPEQGTVGVASAYANAPKKAAQSTNGVVKPGTLANYTPEQKAWIARVAQSRHPVSVLNPHWLGIRSSTQQLFDHILELEDTLDEATGVFYARMLAETGCPVVVLQGFPQTYRHLIAGLKQVAPKVPIMDVWHGNFVQLGENYSWESFQLLSELSRDGLIYKWGFVKRGMAEVLASQGFRTGFVMNIVRTIPTAPAVPLEGGPHIGVWGDHRNWRKPPYAMIAAVSQVNNAVVHAPRLNDRASAFANMMKLNGNFSAEGVEQKDMPSVLARMHVNLYTTLSECAPMLPLESLSVGVPCLFGPNSHYFEDHEYLKQSLVVSQPDDAYMIAQYLQKALHERDKIIHAYREYAPGYNARAKAKLEEFLEVPLPNMQVSQ